MLIEQRPGIQPIERPKLSPDGKPIVRILDFATTSILKCDLFPYARSTIHRPVDEDGFREDFAALLVSRAIGYNEELKRKSFEMNPEIRSAIENITKKGQEVIQKPDDWLSLEKVSQLKDIFEFTTEVGDPRDIDRPYSSSFFLSRYTPRKVIDKDAIIIYRGSSREFWGSFYIKADKSLRVLRDEQIEKGLIPNPHQPGNMGGMDFHLSHSRPRLFLGWNYEIIIQDSSEDFLKLKLNSGLQTSVRDVPNTVLDCFKFLRDLQSGEVVLD